MDLTYDWLSALALEESMLPGTSDATPALENSVGGLPGSKISLSPIIELFGARFSLIPMLILASKEHFGLCLCSMTGDC